MYELIVVSGLLLAIQAVGLHLGAEAGWRKVVIEIADQGQILGFDLLERLVVFGIPVERISNGCLGGFDEVLFDLLVPAVIVLVTVAKDEVAGRPNLGQFSHRRSHSHVVEVDTIQRVIFFRSFLHCIPG